MNSDNTTITERERRQLDETGYLVLEHFISRELLAELRREVECLFQREGAAAGREFKQEQGTRRLANLVDKAEVFQRIITNPTVLQRVEFVLGSEFKLSSLNCRSANPHNETTQPLHADMAAIPDRRGFWVCNTVWMLDDFTADNGALRIVPGSHRFGQLPQTTLSDPTAKHPDQIVVTGKAGTVVVVNAHLWHGGMANRTDAPRTALHAFYCRRDKPQQQYQRSLIRPEVQAKLDEATRWLLALDDPLNDQLSSEHATRSGFLQ